MNKERAQIRIEAAIADALREARQARQPHEQFIVRALRDGFAILIDELDDGPMKRMLDGDEIANMLSKKGEQE